MPLVDLTRKLNALQELSAEELEQAAAALADATVAEAPKADFLTALAAKGETAAEVAGLAEAFRRRAIDPGVGAWSARAIDIVGTGGDHAGGFNISSVVVLVLASAGIPVMKHGNRGITSKCGSADLLAALGVRLDAPADVLRRALDQLGFVFFFAPAFHPSFKHIAPVRKLLAARGQRTVFNIIGPLINPGRPAHVLMGVFAEPWVARLAEVQTRLGMAAGLAVHGDLGDGRGIDELTTSSSNRVKGIGRLAGVDGWWRPEDHGLARSPFDGLRGGDVAENVAMVEAILSGRGAAALVDTVAYNASVAMWILGRTQSIGEGVAWSRELLLGGAVRAKIAATREFFQTT